MSKYQRRNVHGTGWKAGIFAALVFTCSLCCLPVNAADQSSQTATNSPANELNFARNAIQQGDLTTAIRRLEAVSSAATDWEITFWLGTAYLLDGQLDSAAVTLDETLGLAGDNPEVWVQRAVVEQERERSTVALQFLEVAAQVDAGFPLTYLNAAVAYESLGQTDRARSAYGRFLKLTAEDPGSNRLRRLRRDVLVRIAGNSG